MLEKVLEILPDCTHLPKATNPVTIAVTGLEAGPSDKT